MTPAKWGLPLPRTPGVSRSTPWSHLSCNWAPLWSGRIMMTMWKRESLDKSSESRFHKENYEFNFRKADGSLSPVIWASAGSNQDWMVGPNTKQLDACGWNAWCFDAQLVQEIWCFGARRMRTLQKGTLAKSFAWMRANSQSNGPKDCGCGFETGLQFLWFLLNPGHWSMRMNEIRTCGFQKGDRVQWTSSDDDIPEGDIGIVMGVKYEEDSGKKLYVNWPKGRYSMSLLSLQARWPNLLTTLFRKVANRKCK